MGKQGGFKGKYGAIVNVAWTSRFTTEMKRAVSASKTVRQHNRVHGLTRDDGIYHCTEMEGADLSGQLLRPSSPVMSAQEQEGANLS